MAAGIGLCLYILVALLNYSVVQSVVGSIVSAKLSKEWDATMRIGSLHAMPWAHVMADDILLIDPNGDTILCADRLRVRFRHFPYSDHRLAFDRVYLKNAYFHFFVKNHRNSFSFIIDHYKKEKKKKNKKEPFTIDVGTLVLNNVHYQMDLSPKREWRYDKGVVIPHMDFNNVKAKFTNIHVVNDDITTRIVRLAANEKSGFVVDKIKGDVHVCSDSITAQNFLVQTPNSTIDFDGALYYDGWKGMKGYVHTVDHRLNLREGTTVDMSDVAYWAPVLWGWNTKISAFGTAHGKIDSLVAEQMHVRWAERSVADISGSIVGLPKFGNTTIDAQVQHLYTTDTELPQVIPIYQMPESLQLWLSKVGYADMQGSFNGNPLSQCEARVSVGTNLGSIDCNLVRKDNLVRAKVVSDEVELSNFTANNIKSAGVDVAVAMRIPGKGESVEKMQAKVQGTISNLQFSGYNLSHLVVDADYDEGEAELRVHTKDTAISLNIDAIGTLKQDNYHCDATISIPKCNLQVFSDKELKNKLLSTKSISVRVDVSDIQDIDGNIMVKDISLDSINLSTIALNLESGSDSSRRITLRSDIADMDVSGHFAWGEIPLIAKTFMRDYMPFEQNSAVSLPAIADDTRMQCNLRWRDDGEKMATILPKMTLSQGTRFDISYTKNQGITLIGRSSQLGYSNLTMSSVGVIARQDGEKYAVNIESASCDIGDRQLLSNPQVRVSSCSGHADAHIVWGDDTDNLDGDIALSLDNDMVTINNANFFFAQNRWKVDSKTPINLHDGIEVKGLSISTTDQNLTVDIKKNKDKDDRLHVELTNLALDPISDAILYETAFDVEGVANGHLDIYDLSSHPYLGLGLDIDSCHINKQDLGTVVCRSTWNAELNILNMQLYSPKIEAVGWVALQGKERQISVVSSFNNLDLALAAPLLSSFSDRFSGNLNGSIDVKGTLENPIIIGKAEVEDGIIAVNATGVSYFFNDSISLDGNRVLLKDFKVFDNKGNYAAVSGQVNYQQLKEIGMDIHLSTPNITLLSLSSGEQYYGTIMAQADAVVSGTPQNINVDVVASTNEGTTLTIPISQQRRIKEHSYISFVGADNRANVKKGGKKSSTNLYLNADINVTNDAKLNIGVDISSFSVNVEASGNGALHIGMVPSKQPDIIGNYEIVKGDVHVGIFSVVEKIFKIEQGSNITFQGQAADARFDVEAVYSQRVNLSTLTGSLSAVGGTQKYLQVEDIIDVSGTLQEPKIGFDIRLPNADQSTIDEVFSYIDRNSERDMLNQTMSLLVLGQFYNNGDVDAASAVGSGSLGALASIGGSVLGEMLEKVDINFDYKAATDLTNEQFDVNLNKDWGRVYVESTLGYGGESRELESSALGGAVLDALVGYRLTPLVHIFAYNRTNTNDYTRSDLPFKQGIGLKLTKDFDRWGDLFRKSK